MSLCIAEDGKIRDTAGEDMPSCGVLNCMMVIEDNDIEALGKLNPETLMGQSTP
jgi:hypothetical protein